MSFQHRLIPNTAQDEATLLKACGFRNMEELFSGIPKDLRLQRALKVEPGLSEMEMRRRVREMSKNCRRVVHGLSFLGAGVYDHSCPSAVNHLTQRGEFLTAYTPYQPEISQGTLQALFEFQTMIADVFAMDISNASHYDGSTSFAEAAIMALRLNSDRRRIVVSQGVHPEYMAVLRTYLATQRAEITVVPLDENGVTSASALKTSLGDDVGAVMIQSPNFMGCIENQEEIAAQTKKAGALYIASVIEPLSLGICQPPGAYDADIAVGEGQGFGIPESFGGPNVGLFTAKRDYVRQMPGRLCGESIDAQGRRSYTLTLSTREQHIRRDKATSNICSNQNLMALWSTIWLSMVGKSGFKGLAEQNIAKAEYTKEKLIATGKATLRYQNSPTFNEFVIDLKGSAQDLFNKSVARGIAPGLPLSKFNPTDRHGLLVAVTETKSQEEIDLLVDLVREIG